MTVTDAHPPYELDAQAGHVLTNAANLLMAYPYRFWFYGDSVAFEGLQAASILVGNQVWTGFAHGCFRAWAADPEPYRELDNAAPGHAMLDCYERTGDELVLQAARGLAEFLVTRRAIDGVFCSFERSPVHEPYGPIEPTPAQTTIIADPGPGVFVDPLHFDPPFFAHLARVCDQEDYANVATDQALGYCRLLQDPDTGLFAHFWLERYGQAFGCGWSRGQGWALLGLVDTLELIPDDHPARADLVARTVALADGLARTQRPDGHWSAVAYQPESGDEFSTAAFVAVGLARAVRLGVLDAGRFAPVGERAWQATWRSVDRASMLTEVSRTAWPCPVPEHYHHVPKGHPEPWGQGPFLLAATSWLSS